LRLLQPVTAGSNALMGKQQSHSLSPLRFAAKQQRFPIGVKSDELVSFMSPNRQNARVPSVAAITGGVLCLPGGTRLPLFSTIRRRAVVREVRAGNKHETADVRRNANVGPPA